jgi:hypothetical protein
MEKKFDGNKILEEALLNLKIDLTLLVAATGLWANPEVHKTLVREFGNGAWYPGKRRLKKGNGEERGGNLDDNTYANNAIKMALGIKGNEQNFSVCHIWEDSCNDEIDHTTIANLVVLPRPLQSITDFHPEVRAALKYRAYELYEWYPKKKSAPKKPNFYPSNWREPLPFTEKIEKSIERM